MEDYRLELRDALAALVGAVKDHDKARRQREARQAAKMGPAVSVNIPLKLAMGDKVIRSFERIQVRSIPKSPVRNSLKWSIRQVGELAFEFGGKDLMHELLDYVTGLPKHRGDAGFAGNLIDKCWDGVGDQWFA